MAINYKRTTGKPVTGSVSAAIKKPKTIYIGPTDPRNNPEYLAINPNIQVLSAAQWAEWLKTEYSSGSDYGQVSSASLNDSLDPSNIANGNLNATLKPPANIQWDGTFSTVNTDIGILQDIEITFDPSPDDPFDGSFVYEVFYEATATNVAQPATAATSPTTTASVIQTTKNNTVVTSPTTTVGGNTVSKTPVTGTSTTLTFKWPKKANAISYNVIVTGANLPANTGSNKVSYLKVPPSAYTKTYTSGLVHGKYTTSTSGSTFIFTLTQQNGYTFSGTYSAVIQVNYAKQSGVGVTTDNVTI